MPRTTLVLTIAAVLTASGVAVTTARQNETLRAAAPVRPQGPCDIYAAAAAPCVAAHSTTRALYAGYSGPLYQVLRQSDGGMLDIGVVPAVATPVPDPGGYANAAAQDAFCAGTYCWITKIYDQSSKHNDLVQAPRGGFSGPAMGGLNNLPMADMAPLTIMGHKVYGVFIAPGMGLRQNDAKGTAVDDQAEGQYWVINGHHYNSGCCFDYGNAETDSRDDGNGTMETTYYGNATAWYRGNPPGPWIMTDQENNLVGCVTTDGTKLCRDLPNITWRFVTAMAKGEPHHWTSMGGDAQRGRLSVMFDGPRVDHTYDPMRKQGAILLGNGGDNSVGSQGTFYEGAMTAAGTFPSDATDQLVQANVVAARYDVARLQIAPPAATDVPPGLQTFSPGSSQPVTLTFRNIASAAVTGVTLSLTVPRQWRAAVAGSTQTSLTIPDAVPPGARASATFTVSSGTAPFNGDLIGRVSWKDPATGRTQTEMTVEKVRNGSPVKINEFRVHAGSPNNATDSFIELYNDGTRAVDISNWTLTQHQTQQAIFSAATIPAGTMLPPRAFYLLGLSNSGLAAAARAGDTTLHVRSTMGMSVGDTIRIDTGAGAETRKIVRIGTPASNPTTLWQPVPDGPVITIPAGATSVPVTAVAGIAVGEKIALGYGATYPTVAKAIERYEVLTVSAVGKPGTQAFLGVDAPVGAMNIKVTNVANISAGDQIRLDIDSVGHGIETVTVTKVGTASSRTALAADVSAGATSVRVRSANGFVVGDTVTIGTPANRETVTITAVGAANPAGVGVEVTPALGKSHLGREDVVAHGTGLDLSAPLKFVHAANIPFSARGTGIGVMPATAFAHSSNEPVLPLGTGVVIDRALTKAHAVDAVVRDAAVTTAGYQGTPVPNQWFGGPALSPAAGAMVLRDAAGLVVDSLNYGLLVDPWVSEGYHGTSGAGESGCRVATPVAGRGGGGFGGAGGPVSTPHRSAGRFPDGADTDSNCRDFLMQPATTTAAAIAAGGTNLKVASVTDFSAGQTLVIDSGADREAVVIASVGTAGGTVATAAIDAGATLLAVGSTAGFSAGQTITIDAGTSRETAVIATIAGGPGGARMTVTTPLARPHLSGTEIAGSGITLATPVTRAHLAGTQVATALPTPGRPNAYVSRR